MTKFFLGGLKFQPLHTPAFGFFPRYRIHFISLINYIRGSKYFTTTPLIKTQGRVVCCKIK